MSNDAHIAGRDGKCPLCLGLIWSGASTVTWLATSSAWAHVECVERLKRWSYA